MLTELLLAATLVTAAPLDLAKQNLTGEGGGSRFNERTQCAKYQAELDFKEKLLGRKCNKELFEELAQAETIAVPEIATGRGRYKFGSIEGKWELVAVGPFWRDELDENAVVDVLGDFLEIEASDAAGLWVGNGEEKREFPLFALHSKPSEMGRYIVKRGSTPSSTYVRSDKVEVTLDFFRCKPGNYRSLIPSRYLNDCIYIDVVINDYTKRTLDELSVNYDRLVYVRKPDQSAAVSR